MVQTNKNQNTEPTKTEPEAHTIRLPGFIDEEIGFGNVIPTIKKGQLKKRVIV